MPITALASTDTNNGNRQTSTEIRGESFWDVFHHEGKTARCLQGHGLIPQPLLRDRIRGLTSEPKAMHGLGNQAQMAHHWNAHSNHAINRGQGFRLRPLQLHR